MSLSYAGVSLNVWSAEINAWANRTLALSSWRPFNLNDQTFRQLEHLPLPPFTSHDDPVEVGKLYWPRYASRWGQAFFPVTKSQLDEIRAAVGSGNTPQTLIMSNPNPDGSSPDLERIDVLMYMLPPKPISAVQTAEYGGDLWILPLVDRRYWWWYKPFSTEIVSGSTWDSFIGSIFDILGISYGGICPGGFTSVGTLTDRWDNINNAPACLVLDAALETIQRRLVPIIDGIFTGSSDGYVVGCVGDSQTQQSDAYDLFRPKIMSGGLSEPADVSRSIPAYAKVYFGINYDGVNLSNMYSYNTNVTNLYNSGLLTGYSATPYGYSGATAIIVADRYATWNLGLPCDQFIGTSVLPSNYSDITSHATQMSAAWYSWRQGRLDAGYGTLSAWPFNALNDRVVYTYRAGEAGLVVESEPHFNPSVYGSYDNNPTCEENEQNQENLVNVLSRLCVIKDIDGDITDIKYRDADDDCTTVPECDPLSCAPPNTESCDCPTPTSDGPVSLDRYKVTLPTLSGSACCDAWSGLVLILWRPTDTGCVWEVENTGDLPASCDSVPTVTFGSNSLDFNLSIDDGGGNGFIGAIPRYLFDPAAANTFTMISFGTPSGTPYTCFTEGMQVTVEPYGAPTGDAPCPCADCPVAEDGKCCRVMTGGIYQDGEPCYTGTVVLGDNSGLQDFNSTCGPYGPGGEIGWLIEIAPCAGASCGFPAYFTGFVALVEQPNGCYCAPLGPVTMTCLEGEDCTGFTCTIEIIEGYYDPEGMDGGCRTEP